MLCVIQQSFVRIRPSFKSRVQWRPRGMASARRSEQVDARIDGEFNRGVEDIRRVVIQPKRKQPWIEIPR